MAFAAVTETVPPAGWVLFAASAAWIVAYDTLYAMTDRDDDLKNRRQEHGHSPRPPRPGGGGHPAGRNVGRVRRPRLHLRLRLVVHGRAGIDSGPLRLPAATHTRAGSGSLLQGIPEQHLGRFQPVCRSDNRTVRLACFIGSLSERERRRPGRASQATTEVTCASAGGDSRIRNPCCRVPEATPVRQLRSFVPTSVRKVHGLAVRSVSVCLAPRIGNERQLGTGCIGLALHQPLQRVHPAQEVVFLAPLGELRDLGGERLRPFRPGEQALFVELNRKRKRLSACQGSSKSRRSDARACSNRPAPGLVGLDFTGALPDRAPTDQG